jgi:hypothetical protein
MAEQRKRNANSFGLLYSDFCTRFTTPVGQVTFWVYLLIGILVCGGAPIWVELFRFGIGVTQNSENIRTAINCYFPAIGCAAAVQLAFAAEYKQKYLTSFSFFAAFFFFILSILTLALEMKPVTCLAWFVGVVGCLLAILMWWIANGLERTYLDTVDPDAPLGGPTDNPLSGDTTGFAV